MHRQHYAKRANMRAYTATYVPARRAKPVGLCPSPSFVRQTALGYGAFRQVLAVITNFDGIRRIIYHSYKTRGKLTDRLFPEGIYMTMARPTTRMTSQLYN